jgi:cytoskeletal protein CcmA (bactofilin family)
MAANMTIIGRTTRIRGRVTGAVDLEVQGFVEGEIAVGGDVTVDAHGMVGAGIRGRRLLVRGAVKGDLVGDESIVLESGARVVGDVRAPRVAIALGALVRGYVQTGDADAAGARSARVQAAARPAPATPAARPIPAQPAVRPVQAASLAAAPQPASAAKVIRPAAAPPARAAAAANPGPRRPPPPVVPALRSAKGQIAKKKER